MRYELRLVLLAICLFVVWPGAMTMWLFFAALGWLFISCGYTALSGEELIKFPVKDNPLDDY